MSQLYYTLYQGESIPISVYVIDDNSTPVSCTSATSVVCSIYIKETEQISFQTGLTSCIANNFGYNNITSISGNTIQISLTRAETSKFCIGEMKAITFLTNPDGTQIEYSSVIGEVLKGYDKNKIIT